MKPKISVLLSVYNDQDEIADCIQSVLDQSYDNFEFIIVNDGSNDETESIIKSFDDPRIIYVKKENTGLTSSLNAGLKIARGKYVARIDSDDCFYSERLKHQIDTFLKDPNLGLVASKAKIINGPFTYTTPFYSESEILKELMRQNPLVHSSVMISIEHFRSIGFYDEYYRTSQDYDAWIRLSKISRLVMLNKVLVKRKIRSNSISKKKFFIQAKNSYKIRKGKIPVYKNVYHFCYQIVANIIPFNWIRVVKNFLN